MTKAGNIDFATPSRLARRCPTLLLTTALTATISCKGGFESGEVTPAKTSEVSCPNGEIKNGTCIQAPPSMKVTDIDRVIVSPATTSVVTGENFDPTLQVKLLKGDLQLTPAFTVASGTQVNVTMPQDLKRGLLSLNLTQSDSSKRINLISDGGLSDLPIITVAETQVCAGTRYYSADGTELLGTRGCGSSAVPAACRTDGLTGCVTVASYRSADMARFDATKILAGTTIAGVAGTVPTCTTDGQIGCISSSLNPAAALSNVSDTDLRIGKTLAGLAGRLKAGCRNGIKSTTYNYDGSVANLPSIGIATGTNLDHWDTVDDGGGFASFPVTGWANNICDSSNWSDVTTTNGGTTQVTCGTDDTCIQMDTTTNLKVTGIIEAASPNTTDNATPLTAIWSAAVNTCNSSTYGGYPAGTWRLPTQKELMSLYVNGIASKQSSTFVTLANMQAKFWTASTDASDTTKAWYVVIGSGETGKLDKASSSLRVICLN